MISFTGKLDADEKAIQALMPEEPAANDELFMSALDKIQDNIASAITMDALSVSSASDSATAVEDSDNRWAIVNNSIQQLKSASSAAELTAVINSQTISVQAETPAPTATPVSYTTLQKGDKSQSVQNLQTRLVELGYLNDTADGAFGSKTATAVALFQKAAGLSETGIADVQTQTALFADDAPYASATAEVTAAPEDIADADTEAA